MLPVLAVFLAGTACLAGQADAEHIPVPDRTFQQQAESVYLKEREAFATEPDQVERAWKFGRACYDWADYSLSKEERESRANEGIAACRKAVELNPRLAPARYYLALNLGQLARTKSLGALRIVNQMEEEFLQAIEWDESFDFGGPHRSLGILYRDAPGWPASIGNRKKARRHMERALRLHPEYPGNQLDWLETLWQWGEKSEMTNRLAQVEDILQQAREKFTGEEWAAEWSHWDKLWAQLKRQATGT